MAVFKGKGLSLTIDGQEVNVEATAVTLENEEADTDAITFADLASGTPLQWFFTIEARADYAAGTFWSMLWDSAGSDVPFVFKPYGNEVATTAQPHFTGSATVVSKPSVGGTANEAFTFETRLDVIGEPVRTVA